MTRRWQDDRNEAIDFRPPQERTAKHAKRHTEERRKGKGNYSPPPEEKGYEERIVQNVFNVSHDF